jgi:hypothetical protein
MSKFNDLPVLPLGLHPLLWFLSHVPAAFAPTSDETLSPDARAKLYDARILCFFAFCCYIPSPEIVVLPLPRSATIGRICSSTTAGPAHAEDHPHYISELVASYVVVHCTSDAYGYLGGVIRVAHLLLRSVLLDPYRYVVVSSIRVYIAPVCTNMNVDQNSSIHRQAF